MFSYTKSLQLLLVLTLLLLIIFTVLSSLLQSFSLSLTIFLRTTIL